MIPSSALSVDPGSHVAGVALHAPVTPWKGCYRLLAYGVVKEPTNDLVRSVFEWACSLGLFPLRMKIEDQYQMKMRASSLRTLTKSAYRWDVLADDYHLGVEAINPSKWPGKVLPPGSRKRDKKKATSLWIVEQHYGLRVTEDEADAILIGRYCIQQSEVDLGGYIEIETAKDVERKVWR